jgi:hypothetical protein
MWPRKSNRPDPFAIADAVVTVATNKELLAECYSVFAPAAEHRKRANLGAVLFVYCCAHAWSLGKNDARIVAACDIAAELIPNRLKAPDRFVRVGDYLVSEFEVSQLQLVLEEQFQQRIPIPDDAFAKSPEQIGPAIHTAVQNHELHLATLVKAALLLRQQQFADTIERTAHNKDMDITFMVLAGNFDEQITGLTCWNAAHDPQLATEQRMRSMQGAVILGNYSRCIVNELQCAISR